ncbi:MAG TPA: HEAT repeat domain-containing protein, partial [Planctomycetota bacterium]|nr:HEAT repeat domain-containing protein [Planctomycetota bacterium]
MGKSCMILVVAALITVSLWAQEPIEAVNARAGVKGPTILSQHPRLYFRKDDLSWIRRRCATTHRVWYRRMKSHLDALAELDAGADGVQHAMLYQITGDEKYVRAALDASDRTPSPGVYDLLYEAIDPATRQRYADRFGLPGMRSWGGAYAWTSANATTGLALYGDGIVDEERAEILSHLTTFVPQTFDQYAERARVPGGWMASFHCGCFVRNLLPVYSHWAVATGENRFVDSYVWPAQSTWLAQHLIPGRWTLVPLSSAWWGEGKTIDRAALPEVAHFTRSGVAQHLVNRYRRYCVWEYASNPGAYGYHEEVDPEHIGLGYWRGGMHSLYRLILWYDPKMPERPLSDLPTTAFYPVWGHACMRTDWNDDATFAVFKCGWFWGGEPPHHDDGNFVVYHKGNLVLDNNWNFKGCNAHSVNQNTITVRDPDETIMLAQGRDIGKVRSRLNDGGQSFYDPKQTGPFDRGRVVAFEDNPQFLYVAGDATKSYHPDKMKEFVRQFVYVKPNIILIFDRVESTRAEFEKRFVMHTHTEPLLADGVLRADASELLLAQPHLEAIYPYKYGNFVRDSVPGFHQPQYENFETDWQAVDHEDDEPFTRIVASKVPNRKVTLEFECRYGGEEVALVHSTGPQYGTVNWSFDAGKQEGTFSQHAVMPAYQQKQVIVRDLAKGKHTLTLVAPTSLMNVEVFEVKLGGRMFVKTLLPEDAKITVVEGYPESEAYHPRDRYSEKRRYRLEVRPSKPSKRDCFLHVIEVGDLKTSKMTDVTPMADGDTSGVKFDLDGRRYQFVFNRTGEVGGRVSITGDGVAVNRRLTETLNTPKDEAMEASLAKARNARLYDYETRELGELGPQADVATLSKALRAPEWHRRYYAARMLGMKDVKQAERDLVTALSDADPRVVSAAAEALGRLESSAAVLPLTKQLSSPDATARFTAAWALGRIGTSAETVMRALTRTLG